MSVNLRLPTIADNPDPTVEIRPVYVEEWIESLPYANPLVLQRNFHEQLFKLNRTPVKPSTRLTLMELYLRPCEYLLELQERQGPIHSIAILEKQRTDTDAARKISVEMAYGYKTVLANSLGKPSLFGPSKELKLALQRACLFLSYALLHCYGEYLPTPTGYWSEFHALYLHARHRKLLETPVGKTGGRPESAMTVAATYKRMLLTSLVDPYHLGYGNVWNVYSAFSVCIDETTIEAIRNVDKPVGLFVIDPDLDQRPLPYRDAEADLSDNHLLLDANPAMEILMARLDAGNTGDLGARPDRQISTDLIHSIVRALGIPPKRHTPREYSEGRVGLTTGLTSLHHFIGGKRASELASPPAERPDDEYDVGVDTEDQSPEVEGSYTAEYWELQNRGPGGIGIIQRLRPSITIGVGELIGVQIPVKGQADTDWIIGVVRWLSIDNAGEYQAGVQILAQSAEPAAISIRDDQSALDAEPRAALAVPKLAASKTATLIVPPGFFARNVPLLVQTSSASVEIKAEALIESTNTYERISYSILDSG